MPSNVRDMVERRLARATARLRTLPLPPGGDERRLGQRTRAYRPSAACPRRRPTVARRSAAYEDVRRHLAGPWVDAVMGLRRKYSPGRGASRVVA